MITATGKRPLDSQDRFAKELLSFKFLDARILKFHNSLSALALVFFKFVLQYSVY